MSPRTNWGRLGLISLLSVLLYGHVAAGLARSWWSDARLSYGFLVPPLALYIAWTGRQATLAVRAVPDARGLILSGSAWVLYILSELGADVFFQRISLVVLLAGFVWTFWGRGRLRSLAFPFTLLAFMVPLPEAVYSSVAAPLRLLSSDAAAEFARLAGAAIYCDGTTLQLAGTTLTVEDACSGMNSIPSLLIASLLLGKLLCRRMWTRAAVLSLAIPVAVGANVLRIAGTAILADYRRELATGYYHFLAGWSVSLLGFGFLLLTTRWCARHLEEPGLASRR